MAVSTQKSPLNRHLMLLFMAVGGLLVAIPSLGQQPGPPSASSPTATALTIANGPHAKDTKVVVELKQRQVVVYRQDKVLFKYPVAVGQVGWETPIGTFKIIEMRRDPSWQHPITKEVVPPGEDNPLGERWIGFMAGEQMNIGFHGTADESLIGQAVSHGCLRMRNRDVRTLFEQVSMGTPIEVKP
jgi:L,D-transpeptidase ErfK/SrfK